MLWIIGALLLVILIIYKYRWEWETGPTHYEIHEEWKKNYLKKRTMIHEIEPIEFLTSEDVEI